MRVAFATAEFVPLAKSGGLGDACAALADSLSRSGHDVRVFLPYYRQVRDTLGSSAAVELDNMSARIGTAGPGYSIRKVRLPGSSLDIRLIDCPELYDRDWLYTPDADEHRRFALLADAVLGYCEKTGWSPQIIHCHDWHAALLPALRIASYAGVSSLAEARTLITIHNIGFQGVFGGATVDDLGLAAIADRLDRDDMQKDRFNFLKTGLLLADGVSTVSPTYAAEIMTAEFGHGLEHTLATLPRPVTGILNGIDMGLWSPMHDPELPFSYSFLDLSGKAKNKSALLEELGIENAMGIPLVGLVSRLTHQKGLDVVNAALPAFLERDAMAFVVLGSGDARYEATFRDLARRFPDRFHFATGYNEALAHRIFASADITLVPSVFEPCGLTQLYSMRYGAIPVVRRTGGLADTVPNYDSVTGTGLGFSFNRPTPEEFANALERAMMLYRDPPRWQALMRHGMVQDFSWDRPGAAYVDLYRRLTQS